jgi:hypothetical protein
MSISIPEADRRLIGHSGADTRLSTFELPTEDSHKVQASIYVLGIVADRAISISRPDN